MGWLAFCFSLSARSSEVLWQFLAFVPGSVLTGAWLRVPFWHSVTYLPLTNTGAVPFLFAPPFPLPASPYPEGKKVIIHFLFTVPHTYMDDVLLPSAEGLVFGWRWQICCVLMHHKVLKLPVYKLAV